MRSWGLDDREDRDGNQDAEGDEPALRHAGIYPAAPVIAVKAVFATLQPIAASWDLRAIDILITILLTVLIGLSTWALKTVLTHADRFEKVDTSVNRVTQQIWGVDGKNGHASELRDLKRSFRRIERYLMRLGSRLDRVEDKVGLASGEHDRFPDVDEEED